MMVVGDVPGYVDVRLQGQEGMIKRLAVRDISAFVSLSGAVPGEGYFSLTPANVTAPGSIRVVSITPSGVKLRLEKVVRKPLAIRPRLTGSPAAGLRVTRVEVIPVTVNASGPESSLRRLSTVETGDINLNGATGSFDRLVKIESPAGYGVKLEEENARVAITLSKIRKQAGEE
jgi:YbbR domain-containing protein